MVDERMDAETASSTKEGKGKIWGLWRPLALIAVIIALLFAARAFGIGEHIGALREWIQSFGSLGPVVFIVVYVVAVVAMLPGLPLTVAAGSLFGSVEGVIVISIASTIGASLAFLVARYFAREAVAHWLSSKERFQKLDRLTAQQGAIIVATSRLVPIFPFNLLNYGFGLTQVPFWTYVFWSWLCMLPGTVLYVVGADALTKAVMHGKIPWTLVATFVVAAAVLAVIIRQARRKLPDKNNNGTPDDSSTEEVRS